LPIHVFDRLLALIQPGVASLMGSILLADLVGSTPSTLRDHLVLGVLDPEEPLSCVLASGQMVPRHCAIATTVFSVSPFSYVSGSIEVTLMTSAQL
jgi:hypothetical protein